MNPCPKAIKWLEVLCVGFILTSGCASIRPPNPDDVAARKKEVEGNGGKDSWTLIYYLATGIGGAVH
jgi:hypothetical protein